MEVKTNAIRILDKNKIPYLTHNYETSGVINGLDVARVLNQDPGRVFKTLVTCAKSKKNYVFVIPVNTELDLKKAALAVNEKSIEMIRQADLFPLTGYIHGGCSPIGMKKLFPTVFDQSASLFETIIFSAGRIGYQIEMDLRNLKAIIPYELADISIR